MPTPEQAQARRSAKFKLLFWEGFGRYVVCSSCGEVALVAGRRRNALKCEECIDALLDPPARVGSADGGVSARLFTIRELALEPEGFLELGLVARVDGGYVVTDDGLEFSELLDEARCEISEVETACAIDEAS